MCYYVSSDDLIVNVLLIKSSTRNESINEVKTNFSELTHLYDFTFKELKGNCVFEASYRDLLGTIQLYPNRFKYYANDIMFSSLVSPTIDLKKMFALPEKLTKLFEQYFNSCE